MPKHNYPCTFVSKTQKYENLVYDYRLYYNNRKYNAPTTDDNLFREPEHE